MSVGGWERSLALIWPRCPRCGKDFIRRAYLEGFFDHLLSLAFLYPLRCQVCTYRFRVLRFGLGHSTQVPDRRQYQRIATAFPVFLEGQQNREEQVTDLSMGGCTMKAKTSLSEGTFLQLLLQPSDREPPIQVDTAIVRSVRSKSVGLQFLEFPAGEKDRLSQFMYSLLVSSRAAPEVSH